MTVVLRSSEIAVEDRVEVITAAIADGVLPVDISWDAAPAAIDVVCTLAVAGELNFSAARSNDNQFRRTPKHAGVQHDPTVFLALQAYGSTVVEQDGKQSRLGAGDMAIYQSTRPYTVTNIGRTGLYYFQVPRSAVALPSRAVDAIAAEPINARTNVLARSAASFFGSLSRDGALDSPNAAALIAPPSIELLRALIAAQVGDHGLARSSLESSLVLRVQNFVRLHLRERDLTARRIATEHHVSLRHLYGTLARAGVRLHESIQTQRLEGSRRELGDPRQAHLAVATIGARWGFVDPSHFGRVFKAAYGQTPNQWRESCRPGFGGGGP